MYLCTCIFVFRHVYVCMLHYIVCYALGCYDEEQPVSLSRKTGSLTDLWVNFQMSLEEVHTIYGVNSCI